MKTPESLQWSDYIWEIFCHRVDAAVSTAIGDIDAAELSLKKVTEIVVSYGWANGYNIIENDERFQRYLELYPEYVADYAAGIKNGKDEVERDKKLELDREAELTERREQCNDEEDVCGMWVNLLPANYRGPCAIFDPSKGRLIACVPHEQHAFSIAAYCVSHHGGWWEVEVKPATHDQITHQTPEDWLVD